MSSNPTASVSGSSLAAVSARVPTGRGLFAPADAEAPSTGGARPFGLRFAQPPSAGGQPIPAWRLDSATQIALAGDGTPLYLAGGPGRMTNKTTGPSSDGTGSTGGEEWTPDFAGDDGAPL